MSSQVFVEMEYVLLVAYTSVSAFDIVQEPLTFQKSKKDGIGINSERTTLPATDG